MRRKFFCYEVPQAQVKHHLPSALAPISANTVSLHDVARFNDQVTKHIGRHLERFFWASRRTLRQSLHKSLPQLCVLPQLSLGPNPTSVPVLVPDEAGTTLAGVDQS